LWSGINDTQKNEDLGPGRVRLHFAEKLQVGLDGGSAQLVPARGAYFVLDGDERYQRPAYEAREISWGKIEEFQLMGGNELLEKPTEKAGAARFQSAVILPRHPFRSDGAFVLAIFDLSEFLDSVDEPIYQAFVTFPFFPVEHINLGHPWMKVKVRVEELPELVLLCPPITHFDNQATQVRLAFLKKLRVS